jgi:hypothetical protein
MPGEQLGGVFEPPGSMRMVDTQLQGPHRASDFLLLGVGPARRSQVVLPQLAAFDSLPCNDSNQLLHPAGLSAHDTNRVEKPVAGCTQWGREADGQDRPVWS